MTDNSKPKNHVFNAALVHQDLEAHRDLWEVVVFEHKSSGIFGFPKHFTGQTTYYIVPAREHDAMLMQLASRWYPELLRWIELPPPIFQQQLTASSRQVLVAEWSNGNAESPGWNHS